MNIYIVTRHVTGSKWGIAIPNLGVYTSLKSANKHFESVLQDRTRRGSALIVWEHNFTQQNDNIIREALIKDEEEHEHLKIELWKVLPNQGKKGKYGND